MLFEHNSPLKRQTFVSVELFTHFPVPECGEKAHKHCACACVRANLSMFFNGRSQRNPEGRHGGALQTAPRRRVWGRRRPRVWNRAQYRQEVPTRRLHLEPLLSVWLTKAGGGAVSIKQPRRSRRRPSVVTGCRQAHAESALLLRWKCHCAVPHQWSCWSIDRTFLSPQPSCPPWISQELAVKICQSVWMLNEIYCFDTWEVFKTTKSPVIQICSQALINGWLSYVTVMCPVLFLLLN